MIYLKNIAEAQTLMIPRNGEVVTGELSLILRNTTDHQGGSFPVVDQNTSGMYFTLSISVPEGLSNGEYHYQLMDGESLVSCGLLIIGETQKASQHETIITFKQYESN